jgi:hypothetical protein
MRLGYAISISLLAAYAGSQQARAQDIPNLAGPYSCTGRCEGGARIEQSGGSLTCINERNEITYGTVTGRRSFTGCWGLTATVSEDLKSIDWHNGTFWVR